MTNLLVLIALVLIGLHFGRAAERRHYLSLADRENSLHQLSVSTVRRPPVEEVYKTALVSGSTVVSVDFFKVFVAGLKNLIGGRLTTYESLLERARREAILRMKQNAVQLGATSIINTRFETSRISGNASQGIGSVEVLAYGTALSPIKNNPSAMDQ